jgi:LytS/YehU family sensor histidine kinase
MTLSAFLLYKIRIKSIRSKAEIDKKLAQTEMKALHAQMNPHFISNCLNSIREMILNDENKDASRYLTKFAHLIRITLEHSAKSFITLHNTIDYLNRYAELEQIRNNRFTFSQRIGEGLSEDEVMLPPMLIQPFIENAIWHGASARHVTISASYSRAGDQLVCIIEDDGIGIKQSIAGKADQPKMHQSIGLDNIRNRIHLLNEKYGLKSAMHIEDKSDRNIPGQTGTIVTIHLPLQKARS